MLSLQKSTFEELNETLTLQTLKNTERALYSRELMYYTQKHRLEVLSPSPHQDSHQEFWKSWFE